MIKTPIRALLKVAFSVAALLSATSQSSAAVTYWDLNSSAPGAGGSSPAGSWNLTSQFWSSAAAGNGGVGAWFSGDTAVFSAGTDATGTYTVNFPDNLSVGGIVVEEGNVNVSGTGTMTLGGGATFDVQAAGTSLKVGSVIAGSAGLKKVGLGEAMLTSANSFSGIVELNQGVLTIDDGGSLGTGSANVVFTGGTLRNAATTSGALLNASRPIVLNAGGGTIAVPSTALTYSGAISGAGTLTKMGTGALVLNQANAYTGNTVINQGALVVANSTGSATGSGTVQVAPGGVLKGTGRIDGAVMVGGSISPGSSPGTLYTGNQTWGQNGSYLWEINDATGTEGMNPGWDVIDVNGTLTIDATSANPFAINMTTLNAGGTASPLTSFNSNNDYEWTLVRTTGGIVNFAPNKFNLPTGGFLNALGNGQFMLDLSPDQKKLVLRFVHAPVITFQPYSESRTVGSFVVFSVGSSGSQPMTFQWKKDGVALTDGGNISGANNGSLVVNNLTVADEGTYEVVVSNLAGSVTSSGATLTVADAPFITGFPQAQTNLLGTTATFNITASSGLPMTYQWSFNGVALTDGAKFTGTSSASLSIANVALADQGFYQCLVTNAEGTNSAGALLWVIASPTIVAQPTPATNNAGTTAFFTVSATGGDLQYRWKKGANFISDGAKYTGTKSSILQVRDLVAANAGLYSVVITNAAGLAISVPAQLTVIDPAINMHPQPADRLLGASVSFMVTAAGTPTLSYQWKKNGVPLSNTARISGVTSSVLNITGITATDYAMYSVTVSNPKGSVTSLDAELRASEPPTIDSQPEDQTAPPGNNVSFSVLALGTQPFSYQWKKDGVALTDDFYKIWGANSSTLMISSVTEAGDEGTYSVDVTNEAGAISSTAATLTVTNFAPNVTLLAPQEGVEFPAPATVFISADVTDDGEIDFVEFYVNGNVIDTAYGSPYFTVGTNIPGGSYTISARAVDTLGASTTSDPVTIEVGDGCALPPGGAISWWTGDSGADDFYNNNDGSLVSGATTSAGQVGQAFEFNGTGAVLGVPHSPSLSFGPGARMSVEMWVYRTSAAAQGHLLGKRASGCGNYNYQLSYDESGQNGGLRFGGDSGSGFSGVAVTETLPLNDWVHVAGTYDGTTYRLYVNGNLVGSAPGSLGAVNTDVLKIGGSGGCNYFGGMLDEIAIYNRALSDDEVREIYAGGTNGKCTTPMKLETYALFGGPGSQTATAIGIAGSAAYLSGISGDEFQEGLIAKFQLPLLNHTSAPVWSATWPGQSGDDRFNSVAVAADGVYVAGDSYLRTIDTQGNKDSKGMLVKFPFTGTNGVGFGGAVWDKQTPPVPGAFAFSGQETLMGSAVSVENGVTYIYVAGAGQSSSANIGRAFLSKMKTDSSIAWTVRDSSSTSSALSMGRAVAVFNGHVYVAGSSNDESGSPTAKLWKFDLQGNLKWVLGRSTGTFNAITVFAGAVYTVGQSGNQFLAEKWDENGAVLWSQAYPGGDDAEALTGVIGLGSRIYAVGWTENFTEGGADAVITEIDPASGSILSYLTHGGSSDDEATGIATDGQDLYVVGQRGSNLILVDGEGRGEGQNEETFPIGGGGNEAMLLRFRVSQPIVPLQIITTNLPYGEVGKPYHTVVQATGGKAPYSWSLTTGSLPSGLTLTTNGIISGSPLSDGSLTAGITVTDSSETQQSIQQNFTIDILVSNDIPNVVITTPSDGDSADAPATFEVEVTVVDTHTINEVGIVVNGNSMARLFNPPYTATLSSLPPGPYTIRATARDSHGAVGISAPVSVRVNAPGTTVVDFEALNTDSGEVEATPLNTYVNRYGINLTNETGGSRLVVNSATGLIASGLVVPSSGRNVFTQVDVNGKNSYTIGFDTPVGSFEFTRVKLLPGLRGVSHPEWKATAFDASGVELAHVREDLLSSTVAIPEKTFRLSGPDIAFVRVESDNRGISAFKSALLDDFVMHDDVGNIPPTVLFLAPEEDETFSAPASVTLSAVATDDGSITNISFYLGETLVGSSVANPASVVVPNLSPGTYFVKAVATDDQGAFRSSPPRRFTVTQSSGISMINFDSIDAGGRNVGGTSLSNYLWSYGVTIKGATLGSRVEVADVRNLAGGSTVVPASPRNVLTQVGLSGPSAYTLRFENPMQSVRFVRPALRAGSSGVTHTAWRARAFDSSGAELATVGENAINSLADVAAQEYELRAAGILWVRFESDGGRNMFNSVLIDDVVLNSNPVLTLLAVNITSPGQNATFTAPADILVTADAENTLGSVAKVEFYAGSTLIGLSTEEPYQVNWQNVLAGEYALRAKVHNSLGAAAWSPAVNVTVEAGAGGDATIVNFDALDATGGPVVGPGLSTYLNTFGITLVSETSGTVQVRHQASFLNGTTVQAASSPNVFTQVGASDTMDFTLEFSEPLQSFQFTRPKLRAGTVGITHPEWTAYAYDAADVEVDLASESFSSSYSDVDPAIFVLQGEGITKVKFQSNNRRTAAFKAVLLDDFILTTSTDNLPPVVKITDPVPGNVFLAPAEITITADAFDHDGSIDYVEFYEDGNLLETVHEAPYTIAWTNVSVGRYTLNAVAWDNSESSKVSEPVTITVEPRADVFGILTHPQDQTVAPGGTATFSVTTTDLGPVTYQWLLNGTSILNETESTLVLGNVDASDAGSYSAEVSFEGITLESDSASLTIAEGPVILTQPQGQSVNVGDTAYFEVEADGARPLKYQWLRNGNPIRGATDFSFEIPDVKATHAGNYSVVVANVIGATRSSQANLSVVVGSGSLSTADDFADRITFNPLESAVFGNNADASSESGEPDHAGKSGGKSIWYTWKATFTGSLTLSTLGSSFDTLLAVYTGTDVANLSLVAANDDARDGYFTSQVIFNVLEGVDYHIAVDGFFAASGSVTLSMPDGGYRVLDIGGSNEALPVIVNQPVSRSVPADSTVVLSVTVASETPLLYQWFYNDLPVLDATNDTFAISEFSLGSVGRYHVLVANDVGSVESEAARLQIISGEMEDPEGVSSQDKFLSSVGSGVTASSGHAPKVPDGNAGPSRGYTTTQIFSTVGSTKEVGEQNHAGEPGGASEWYVYAPPESGTLHINTDGSTFNTVIAVYVGSGFGFDTLTLVASDNSSSGLGGDRVRFEGVQDTVYFIAVDGVGGATGTANLNINLGTAPAITVAPVSKSVVLGNNALFSVTATGTTNLSYQWRFKGANIAGATSSSYTRTGVQNSHAGAYTVVVSNLISMVTNAPSAALTIATAPSITVQPTSRTVIAGTNTTLSVTATGTETLKYQWMKNGANVAGATQSALTLTSIQTTAAGGYTVSVSNIVGVITSQVATVTVSVPTPVLTSHAEGGVVTNSAVALSGTAPGNARISQVQVRINNGSFAAAAGTTGWSTNVTLIPGTNTIVMRAIDQSGFQSANRTNTIFYSSFALFTLQIHGSGDVASANTKIGGITYTPTNNASLVVDKVYKLTASVGKGTNYIFTNWTDHVGDILGTNAVLNYVMTTNGHVNANFIVNPFTAAAGIYAGLFYDTNGISHDSSGYFTIKTTSKLAYSAKMLLDGNAVSVSGKFALPGTAEKTVVRMTKFGKPDLTIAFSLDFSNNTERVVGTLSSPGQWTAELIGDRMVWTTNRLATAFTNQYTMAIPPVETDSALGPVGFGYGLLTVTEAGKVKIAGGMGDAHVMKQSTFVSKNGELPFYAPLYAELRDFNGKFLKEYKGSTMGWLTLATNVPAGQTTLAPQGPVSWIKTGWTNEAYSEGFTNEASILGSKFLAPAKNSGVRVLDMSSATVVLSGGNLPEALTNTFTLSVNNVFTADLPNPESMKITPVSKGSWKGAFVHPENSDRPTRFLGAVLQDYNFARGYFVGTNETGAATLDE